MDLRQTAAELAFLHAVLDKKIGRELMGLAA